MEVFCDLRELCLELSISGELSEKQIKKLMIAEVEYKNNSQKFVLAPLGEVYFPNVKMGKIESSHLLQKDEIVIFALYFALAKKGVNGMSLDLGANLGLHSLILSKLGFSVIAVEPDPIHLKILSEVLTLNKVNNVEVVAAAVTPGGEPAQFIRIINNTTSSHVKGSVGKSPYGPTTEFQVQGMSLKNTLDSNNISLVKMDIEGMELEIINTLENRHFLETDFIIEIGSPVARSGIWKYLGTIPEVNVFVQKNRWNKAHLEDDLPNSYKEGMIFVSRKKEIPW